MIRYYALYGGVGEWELVTREEYLRLKSLPHEERPTDINDYRDFETLKDAKKYLRMHLQGDINDCRLALSYIKEWKKK